MLLLSYKGQIGIPPKASLAVDESKKVESIVYTKKGHEVLRGRELESIEMLL